MLISNSVVKLLTSASTREIVDAGGIGFYKADENRVTRTRYLLCVSNGVVRDEIAEPPRETAHGEGFLIGKISGATRVRDGRLFIRLRQYALVKIPAAWDGSQNPVRYASKESIEARVGALDKLDWTPMPVMASESTLDRSAPRTGLTDAPEIGALTFDQAKIGLAKTFGVDPSQIEITIKG